MSHIEREMHYVLEVKIQEVVNLTTTANAATRDLPKKERVINDVAHYVIKGKTLAHLVTKGAQLLDLSGQ